MSLKFIDGFGHYEDNLEMAKWETFSDTGSLTMASGYGSQGDYGVRMSTSTADYAQTRSGVLGTISTVIVGCRLRFTGFASGYVMAFRDGTDTQFSIKIKSDGSIELYRGADATLLASSSTGVVSSGVWFYFEIKVVFSQTVGTVDVKVDGASVISDTGLDTCQTANASIDSFRFRGGPVYMYMDDLYICDDSGSKNNDFLGDCRVHTLYPDADGNHSDFTPSTGSDHYAMVDDAQPTSVDTDYNESSTVGHKDTYSMDTYAEDGTIYGIQVCSAVRNPDTGTMTVRNLCRSGATPTDNEGASLTLSQSDQMAIDVWEQEPTDTVDWTAAKINAAEFGIKVQS